MMTSVTLPSSSAPLHSSFATSVVSEETTSSEPEFETPRPVKRCSITPLTDSCKKRRKQSTPVRIAAESEGKPNSTSPEPESSTELQCPVCQLYFDTDDQLQHHILTEHASATVVKKEFEDFETPLELTNRMEVPWMSDLQQINPNLLPSLNPMFMGLPQFTQPDTLPRQPIRIFNPDAYCDLCNKEFCNKYFLKTHKANKHGIYSDPSNENSFTTPTTTMKLPPTSVPTIELTVKSTEKPIHTFNNFFPNPFANHQKSTTKTKQQQQPFTENESSENSPNGFATSNENDKVPSPSIEQTEESSSPRNSQTESTSFKAEAAADSIYYITPSKQSPNDDNRFRRIGVMNPKAFCEICCKEYCNKYFLRTHKMKRHGIYIPDEKDPKLDGVPFSWQQHNMQTSPLNLIMTEQSNDRKTTSPSDIICDSCGIKFQNVGLFQLHNISVHKQHKLDEQTENDESKKDEKVNAEAISEDLQKLQTMILQLNELDVGKICATCSACNKEFENRYFLHAHMMTEHGILLDDVNDVDKVQDGGENNSNNNTVCDLCGKDVQNVDEMKKHLLEFHPNHQQDNVMKDVDFNTPEKSVVNRLVNSDRRISMNVTPTSSYCDICNKELCNKYFMKTHMQRMHGIEIENGAQIGGVICDICNKELCSKYFLRVHKHNTHGIVEYGTSLLQPRKNENEPIPPPPEPDPALKPADLADLSHRYFSHFTEVCSICSRRFRSTKWLKAHLLSDHGQIGAEKWSELEQQLQQSIGQHSKNPIKSERSSPTLKIPNGGQERKEVGIQNVLSSLFGVDEINAKTYACSYCPFTTPLLPLLFVHERSHSLSSEGGNPLKCPVCNQTFLQPELLQHHIFAQHPFLPLPPFFSNGSDAADNMEDKKAKGKMEVVLKDVAKRVQFPATYALPSDDVGSYVMQAFLVEETGSEKRIMPSVVFLPVVQKQPTPLTVTLTLTPA